MNFSPMNIRMAVPHATDVGQLQHNMNHHGAAVQDFKALKDREQQEVMQKQVRTKDETEGEKIKENPDRDRGQGGYSANKRKKGSTAVLDSSEETEQEKMAIDTFRGHNIDISL